MPLANFPMLTFEQANPWLSGAAAGQKLYQGMIENMYAQPTAQKTLEQLTAKTQQDQAKAKYAMPMELANLQEQQQKAPLLESQIKEILQGRIPQEQASTGLTNAQSNLLRQTTPYEVQSKKLGVYTDPMLRRLAELQQAKTTGGINPNLMAMLTGQVGNSTQNVEPTAGQIGDVHLTGPELDKYRQLVGGQLGAQQGMPQEQQPTLQQMIQTPQQVSPAMAPQNYGGNTLQNWALTGSPLSMYQQMQLKAMGKGMEAQSTTGVQEYNKHLDAAQSSADDATQMKNLVDDFNDAYDKATLKGPVKGLTPSSFSSAHGITQNAAFLTAATGGHDFSAEQQADNAAQNMQQMILKLMKTSRLTNYELNFAGNLKLNRSMTPQTKEMVGDWLKAKSERLIEQQDFLNAAKNNGVDVQTANTLWNQYNNQRPVYDFKDKKTNEKFQGKWADYLSPDAVNAAKTGQSFVPSNITKDDLKYLTPQQRAMVYQQIGK